MPVSAALFLRPSAPTLLVAISHFGSKASSLIQFCCVITSKGIDNRRPESPIGFAAVTKPSQPVHHTLLSLCRQRLFFPIAIGLFLFAHLIVLRLDHGRLRRTTADRGDQGCHHETSAQQKLHEINERVRSMRIKTEPTDQDRTRRPFEHADIIKTSHGQTRQVNRRIRIKIHVSTRSIWSKRK